MISNSLIIATYNKPDALDLVLKSVLKQSQLPGEILIADDGSGEDTQKLIRQYQDEQIIPIRHIWHEDQGFRLSAIRNKAIAAANGEYIIQIDGDVLLHRHFIKDHVAFARENSFVRASRIYLDENLTRMLMTREKTHFSILEKGVSNRTSAMRVPFLWSLFETNYKNKGDEVYEIHGCNMAFFKSDAIKVNGYNEDFEGWGYEDKEFVARLLVAGVKKRFLKMGGIVFHLHHPISSMHREKENSIILKNTIQHGMIFCTNGISKYL
jgi:glycosyltransferase involved in cell wall biosynthesis